MKENTRATGKNLAYSVLALCCLAMVATMFLRACPAILALELQEAFQASKTDIALFSSATLLAYGLMQLPSGLLTDGLGGRKTLVLFLFLAALSTLAFAFAGTLSIGVAARFIKGLTLAIVPPAATIISRYFPADRQTQAVAIFMGSANLGGLVAAEPLARLSIALGWRMAMAVSATAILALAVVAFLVIRERPTGSFSPASAIEPPAPVPLAAKIRGIGLNMIRIFKTPQYWLIAFWQVFTATTFFTFFTMWAGPYLMEAYALSQIEASRILLVQGVCAIIVVPIIGTFADMLGSRRKMLIICSVLGILGSCGLAFFAGKLPAPLLVASIVSVSSFSVGGTTCCMSLVTRNFPKEMTGTGLGCNNMLWPFLASITGVMLGVFLQWNIGRQGDAASVNMAQAYGTTFTVYVVFWVASLILALFFIKEKFTVAD